MIRFFLSPFLIQVQCLLPNAWQFWMLLQKFPNIIAQDDLWKLDSDGMNFHSLIFPKKIHMDHYWGDVAALTGGCGEIKFPTLGYFVKSFLSLPHSNADVERILSQVTLIKTKQRNKLKTSTLDSLLMTHSGLPTNCMNFRPKICMCSSLTSAMYRQCQWQLWIWGCLKCITFQFLCPSNMHVGSGKI